jgi:hypothetical protein
VTAPYKLMDLWYILLICKKDVQFETEWVVNFDTCLFSDVVNVANEVKSMTHFVKYITRKLNSAVSTFPFAESRLVGTYIDFQMGRARLAARGTTLKSTALARPETRSIVPSAGPARRPFSAWAATSARRASPRHDPIQGGPKAARPASSLPPSPGLASSQPLDRRLPAVGSALGQRLYKPRAPPPAPAPKAPIQ